MNTDTFENSVMKAILDGDHPLLDQLRKQYKLATISHTESSGVGLFVHFALDESAEKVIPEHFVLKDLHLEITDVESGAGAILFVRNGWIDFLEIHTYVGNWPDDPHLRSYKYWRLKASSKNEEELSDTRDLVKLETELFGI